DLKKAEQLQMSNLSPELQESIEQLKAAAQSVTRPYEQQNTIHPAPAAAEVKAEPAQPAATMTHDEAPMVTSVQSTDALADKKEEVKP
ncbi:MAG: Sec-independent protein translocase protein TatB, partial [Aeromonas salmonicida]